MRSFIRILAHFRACGKVNDYMSQIGLVLSHSEPGIDYFSTSGTSGSSVLLGVKALWSRKNKNSDVTSGPLAHPFPHLLTLLTHLLALHRTLCSRSLLRSFICSLTHSQGRGKVNDHMSQIDLILSHSEPGIDFSSKALCCTHSFARLLTHSQARGKVND